MKKTISVVLLVCLLMVGMVGTASAETSEESGSPDVTCQGDNSPSDVYDGEQKVGSLLWDSPETGQVTFEADEGYEGYTVTLCVNGSTDVFEAVLGDGEASRVAKTPSGQAAGISNVKIRSVNAPPDDNGGDDDNGDPDNGNGGDDNGDDTNGDNGNGDDDDENGNDDNGEVDVPDLVYGHTTPICTGENTFGVRAHVTNPADFDRTVVRSINDTVEEFVIPAGAIETTLDVDDIPRGGAYSLAYGEIELISLTDKDVDYSHPDCTPPPADDDDPDLPPPPNGDGDNGDNGENGNGDGPDDDNGEPDDEPEPDEPADDDPVSDDDPVDDTPADKPSKDDTSDTRVTIEDTDESVVVVEDDTKVTVAEVQLDEYEPTAVTAAPAATDAKLAHTGVNSTVLALLGLLLAAAGALVLRRTSA